MDIIACMLSVSYFLASFFLTRKKKLISPSVLFFALWSFILFLSILNLYNIYKPSDEAYILIMLMLTFFFLGNIFSILIKNKNIKLPKLNRKQKKSNEQVEIKPMFKLFYGLSFLIIVFNVIDFIIIIKESLAGTPMWQIRNWSLEPYGSSNPILDRRSFIEDAFRSIVLAPFGIIIHPIAAFYFFNSKDKMQKYKLLIVSAMVLIVGSLAGGGGRLGFIYYFGCYMLSFLVANINNEISKDTIKKYKKIVMLILIVGVLFVIIYTTIRTGAGNLIKQVYTYFALPPTLLSVWLPDIKNVEYTYGMTSFFGVHSYFFRVLDTIGLEFLIPQIYNNAYTNIVNAEIFKPVGFGIGNAFVTPVYYFFVDGGYPFVCIASFIFGYIVSNLYEKFEININVRSFSIYTLITYGIFLTFIRVQTAIPAYIIAFVLIYIILRPHKQKEIKKNGAGDLDNEKNN